MTYPLGRSFFKYLSPQLKVEGDGEGGNYKRCLKKIEPIFLTVKYLHETSFFYLGCLSLVLTIHMTGKELKKPSLFLIIITVHSKIFRNLVCRFAPKLSALYLYSLHMWLSDCHSMRFINHWELVIDWLLLAFDIWF